MATEEYHKYIFSFQFGCFADHQVWHQHDREATEEGRGQPEEVTQLEQRRGQPRRGWEPQSSLSQEGHRGRGGLQGKL